MKPWIINAEPQKDELISSWLIRLAIANGDDPIGLTQKLWGKWRAWTMDFDRYCQPEKINDLSKVSGLSKKQLISMTLQPTIEKVINDKDLNLTMRWPWVIPTGRRNRTAVNGLHFCPDCITDNPIYFKKSWRLAWNVACPNHKSLLVINCPECNTVISPHLITYDKTELTQCTHCGYDLKNTTTSEASDEVIGFQELLNTSLAIDLNKCIVNQDISIPKDIKTSCDLFSATLFLMKFFYSLRRYKKPYKYLIDYLGLTDENDKCTSVSGGVIETLPVQYRHFLLLATSRLLSFEKNEIIQILQDANVSQQKFGIGGITNGFIFEVQALLNDNPIKRPSRVVKQLEILPRSKQEVDQLMSEEIRPYL